ncbi:MAG: hypothetical protein QM817_38095 [Archangium sp.]
MNRALFVIYVVLTSACATPVATCSCTAEQSCVFRAGAVNPTCEKSCDVTDAGIACPSGTSCLCAASCKGCKDCVAVCL